MKILHKENIVTLDYRTYDCVIPDVMVYNTSDRKIWYGRIDGNETCLKVRYIFDSGFINNPGILEFLFDPDKQFEINWKDPVEVLKINRFCNLQVKDISISLLIELIAKLTFNSWTAGFTYGEIHLQDNLKKLLGITNGKS